MSYHYVRESQKTAFPRLKALPPESFAHQLESLERERTIIDYAPFLSAIDTGQAVGGAALVTFDDGLVDHYETVFPAIASRGHRGVFFISPETNINATRVLNVQKVQLLLAHLGDRLWEEVEGALAMVGAGLVPPQPHSSLYRYDSAAVRQVKQLLNYDLPIGVADALLAELFRTHIGDEREVASELYLTSAMIREMSRAGMTFGYHTRDHRVLSRLSIDEQNDQLQGGVEWIRSLTNQATVPFCYPHGHAHAYTAGTITLLQELGYSMAFTAVRGACRTHVDQRFELPRFDTRDVPIGEPASAPVSVGGRSVGLA